MMKLRFVFFLIVLFSSGNLFSQNSTFVVLNNQNNSTFRATNCVDEDFIDFSDWTNNGTATDNVVSHAGVLIPCRAVGSGDNIISPISNNPNLLTFFQDSSGGANGNAATVDYRINGGTWITFHTFNVTTAGNTETVDLTNLSGVDLSNETNVEFRFNSSFNTWYLDDVTITCGTVCSPSHTVSSFAPTEGPVGTNVTISGTGFTPGTTVTMAGVNTTIISQNSTSLIIEIPSGAGSNNFSILESGCEIETTSPFTVYNTSGGCFSGPSFTDVFISEVTDASAGSLSYIEIFNGTGAAINLGSQNYALRFKSNGGPETDLALTGILNNADSFIFATSVGAGCSVPGGDGSYADQSEVFSGVNNNDCISLLKNSSIIDVWGECDGSSWITALGLGSAGYDFQRKSTATAPNITFDSNDWTIVDYSSCNDNYTDIETYAGSTSFPSITNQPDNVGTCDSTASFTIDAVPVNSGTLTYQWYFNNGISATWTVVTNASFPLATITGEMTNTLNLNGSLSAYSDYQFYCAVNEDASCITASNAVQIKSDSTTWNGTTWDNGTPNATKTAVLNGNYSTGTDGSFSACSLLINTGFTLNVNNNSYTEITNEITNNGQLIIADSGSVVQINDTATYVDSGSSAAIPTQVNKFTAPIINWYEYTYWSSPVSNALAGNALADAHPARRFYFEAANYVDAYYESNNDNTQTYGPNVDGFDDNADVWQYALAGDVLIPGVGYIASHSSWSMVSGQTEYEYNFRGALNSGIINVPVERNDTETADESWNLIGNPFASAIDVDKFFTANRFDVAASGTIQPEIHMWTHSVAPSATANGNQQYNFSASDYAIINATGEVAGGDLNNDLVIDASDIPNRFVPSCQSFFVNYEQSIANATGNIVFNNDMRVTGSNNQFFKTGNTPNNKLWLNLSTDFGMYNQIMVGYVNGATSGYDKGTYDAKKVGFYKATVSFYSLIEANNDSKKLAIQGKPQEQLNLDEVIPLGFKSIISDPVIYTISIDKLQGEFLTNNTIFLKDNLLDTYTNLSDNDYSFVSLPGIHNKRFEIVFKTKKAEEIELSSSENGSPVLYEINNILNIKTNSDLKISKAKIYNAIGQKIIEKKNIFNNTLEINIGSLSQGLYVTELTFENGTKMLTKLIKK